MLLKPARTCLLLVSLAGAALAAPAVAAAATLCVNVGGTGSCHATIQGAVDAATSGDTIDVEAGTYSTGTRVDINKPLTLQGPNHGVALDATRGTEAEVADGFYLLASNITIDGFWFNGPSVAPNNGKISTSTAMHNDHVTISSNRFDNLSQNAVRHQHNNFVGTNEDLQDTDWVLNDNTVTGWTGANVTAFLIWGIDNVQIRDNRVEQTLGTPTATGLNLNSSRHSIVTGNHFTGMKNLAVQVSASWIDVVDVEVSHNVVRNVGTFNFQEGNGNPDRINSDAGLGISLRTDAAPWTMSNVRVISNDTALTSGAGVSIHAGSLSALSDILIDDNDVLLDASILARTFVAGIDVPLNDNAATPHGRVTVTNNRVRFTGTAALGSTPVGIAVRGEAVDVVVQGNSVDGGGVTAEPSAFLPASGVLLLTNEVDLTHVQWNTGAMPANAVISITGNDITGFTNALTSSETKLGPIAAPPLGAVITFNGNVVTGVTGSAIETGASGAEIDAEDNAWDCEGTLGDPGCPTAAGSVGSAARVALGGSASPTSIAANGSGATITADLTRNSGGTPVSAFVRNGTPVAFSTNLGTITASATTTAGLATATLAPGATAGTATVHIEAVGLSRDVVVTITEPVAGGGGGSVGGTGGGTSNPATDSPALSWLRLSSTRFRAATSGASLRAKRPPVGTTVRWTLSAAATVKLTVSRARPGRLVGGRCVAPQPGNATATSCRRFVAVRGAMQRVARAGAHRVRFTGRLRNQALAPGSYRLSAIPIGAKAGTRPARVGFTIVR